MREAVQQLFVALAFYTRLPSPRWVEHTPGRQTRSAVYAPVAGWVVGLIAAAVYWASAQLLPASIAVLLSMLAGTWLTGAIHEDALADFCDAFGGRHDKARALEIMKDARTGVYGAVALCFALLLKFFALVEIARLPGSGVMLMGVLLVSAHGLSRFCAISFMYKQTYISAREDAKSGAVTGAPNSLAIAVSALVSLLPWVVLSALTTPWILLGVLAMLVARYLTGRLFLRRLGGYTGDCLGTVQQTTELVSYLAACAVLFTGI